VLILSIDTCDSRGSLALLRNNAILRTISHTTNEDYSSWLLPAVNGLLADAGLRLTDVDLYAVAAGPGSFTGLRVGLTAIKAWSEVYARPIVVVSRLEALAVQAEPAGMRNDRGALIGSFIDARRGQLFAALYRQSDDSLERTGDEMVIEPSGFLAFVEEHGKDERISWVSLDPESVTETEGWRSHRERGESVQKISPVLAPIIGDLGYKRANTGQLTDALALDANYVRRSDAEIFWKGAKPTV